MKRWTNRRSARAPRGTRPDCRPAGIASSSMARRSRSSSGYRTMHRRELVPLVVLVAGCAARRPAPPLAGPSSAPVLETPARVALIAAPGDADWTALGDEATALLSQYLRINTTNPPGNEIAAARWLAAVLRRDGIEARVLEPAPGKANLYARLAGDGSARPLILLNHMDVVLASPDYWTVDPFSGVIKDGYVWGRGALDMKGEAIAQLMTMLVLKRAHVPLKRDIIFLATSDEEIGAGVGAAWIVEHQADLIRNAEFLLNEGGLTRSDGHGGVQYYGIGTTEKSPFWLDAIARGTAGHGSPPAPDKPVHRVVRAALDVRLLPGQDPAAFLADLVRLVGDSAVTFRPQGPNWPATESPTETEMFRAITAVAHARHPNALVTTLMLPGFTDSHYFRRLGIASYGLGPFPLSQGDSRGVHGNDERVRLDALRFGVRFYYDVVSRVAAK